MKSKTIWLILLVVAILTMAGCVAPGNRSWPLWATYEVPVNYDGTNWSAIVEVDDLIETSTSQKYHVVETSPGLMVDRMATEGEQPLYYFVKCTIAQGGQISSNGKPGELNVEQDGETYVISSFVEFHLYRKVR